MLVNQFCKVDRAQQQQMHAKNYLQAFVNPAVRSIASGERPPGEDILPKSLLARRSKPGAYLPHLLVHYIVRARDVCAYVQYYIYNGDHTRCDTFHRKRVRCSDPIRHIRGGARERASARASSNYSLYYCCSSCATE